MFSPLEWIKKLNSISNVVKCKVSNNPSSLDEAFKMLAFFFNEAKKNNYNLWWVGNGGSSAICSHLSQDALNRLGIRSMPLSDASLLTCMANDFGYNKVFKNSLEKLAVKNDILIAISSSGNSENILSCAELAKQKKMKLVTLSGFNEDNKLWQVQSDISFYLPFNLYGLVEVGHEALLHSVMECLWINEYYKPKQGE